MPLELLAPPSALDRIGFELGWDYGRYHLEPADPHADANTPLHHGLRAARATFGARRLHAGVPVQQWLALRLSAWLRGRSVETLQVTPNYLAQLTVTHCPVTRRPLGGADEDDAATFNRVRNDAAYAAGNIAMLSARAGRAKGALDHRGALQVAQRAAQGLLHGLDADGWWRVALLCSFVEPLPHDEACALPLRLLPPNRLRLFNPAQALQTALSRLLLADGWSAQTRRIAALLPAGPARRGLLEFMAALLPRFLEAGRDLPALEARRAIEDAWRAPLVLKRWQAFACPLGAAGCESLLLRAARRGLIAQHVCSHADAAATDGWALATRGHVPALDPASSERAPARPPVRRSALRASQPRGVPAAARPAQARLPL